ncbi:hypothetical protein [Kutzneria chonburiensis]|uniref:hypothetical protein n=1 Tax=Kutzneria chonburiensis TaxID=1483604 RepID=UPI0030818EF8
MSASATAVDTARRRAAMPVPWVSSNRSWSRAWAAVITEPTNLVNVGTVLAECSGASRPMTPVRCRGADVRRLCGR